MQNAVSSAPDNALDQAWKAVRETMTAFTVLAMTTIRTVFLEADGKDLETERISSTFGILVRRTVAKNLHSQSCMMI